MSVLLDTSEPSERAPRLLNRPRDKLRLRFLSGGIVSRSSDADGQRHLYSTRPRKHSDRDLEHLSNNPK